MPGSCVPYYMLQVLLTLCMSVSALALEGDITGNLTVDWDDLSVISNNWLDDNCSLSLWCEGADINHSNDVSFTDFALLANNWLQTERLPTSGKIVAERWKHGWGCWFVYQPTGVGDWYRWRIAYRNLVGTGDATYPCLAGVSRGQVYNGWIKNFNTHDYRQGLDYGPSVFATTSAVYGLQGEYRGWNIPLGATHVRAWFQAGAGLTSATTQATVATWSGNIVYGSAVNTVVTNTSAVGASTVYITPSKWLAISGSADKVKIYTPEGGGKRIYLIGVEFININSVTAPSTEGSIFFDGEGGTSKTVIADDKWGATFSGSTVEFTLIWNDNGGTYNGNYIIGGISHAGISDNEGMGMVTWQMQNASFSPALWTPNQGDKTKDIDYLIVSMGNMGAYLNPAATLNETNRRGTITSSLVFNSSGCVTSTTLTVDAGRDMDVFQTYAVQCRFAPDVNFGQFFGEPTIQKIGKNKLISSVKSDGLRVWGGSNDTFYEIYLLDASDVDYFYHIATPASYYPNITIPNNPKFYIHMTDLSTSTKQLDLGAGETFRTKFKIKLADINTLGSSPP